MTTITPQLVPDQPVGNPLVPILESLTVAVSTANQTIAMLDGDVRRAVRNKETAGAIRELAARTGASLTEATDRAVRAELSRLDSARAQESAPERLERMRRFTDSLQARAAAGSSSWVGDGDLYDADGLPR